MRYASLPILLLTTPLFAADVDYARDVQPLLSEFCYNCHGPDANARKGKLRLDTEEGALRNEKPVILPGKSNESELLKRIGSADSDEVMPPPRSKKKLTAEQITTLKNWIDSGAKWGTHWAFVKPKQPAVPHVPGLVRNPIDAFIQTRLLREGLKPSDEAAKSTLIRRVTLDLTGLPPTTAEVEAFLADSSPTAYEKVVDRLLASPRYGERMVWEWLDAARYADSNGYQGDGERTMWPWRDWAVKAFNDDLPFDRFTVLQLAGDLLPKAGVEEKLPTGFLRNHMINGEGGRIPDENRVDYVMDMTETTGTIWLGLTFNCCRCHDHKFDPVKQSEYYGLFAFFNQTPVTGGGGDPQSKPVVELRTPADEAKLKEQNDKIALLAKEIGELESKLPAELTEKAPKEVKDAIKPAPANRTRAQLAVLEKHFAKETAFAQKLKTLSAAVSARDDTAKKVTRVMVMEDQTTPRETFILTKGLYNKPAEKVAAGIPAVLGSLPAGAPRNRLTLANWLVSPDNPLTARVAVNRLWLQFFGVGLVKTVEDFGVQGERPGNQPLLDWLAVEFRERGWSIKHLVKLLVTSATYRQSSKLTPTLAERDPDNRLNARGPRYRLPSWMIRDQALAASGLLVGTLGGPPVNGYQPAGIWEEATFGTKRYTQDHGEALYRRSLYTFWRRIVGPTLFFDVAARQTCTVKQTRTNTPLHALATLNDVTYVEAARALAERIMTAETEDAKRIELAVKLVLCRKPSAEEATVFEAGLKRLKAQFTADVSAARKLLAVGESKRNTKLDAAEHAAFTELMSILFNLDEALTKE